MGIGPQKARGRLGSLLIAAALVVVSCGSGAAEVSSGQAAGQGPESDEPRVGCPNGPFFALDVLETAPPLIEDSEFPEIAAAIAPFLDSGEGDFWPQDGWRILDVQDGRAELVHLGSVDMPQLAFMGATQAGGQWSWAGSSMGSDCILVQAPTADSGSIVDWVLDPAAPSITPESTQLVLRASERACASGQAMGDRLREPTVAYTATQVRIGLAADPLAGDQTCPSNPDVEVIVELAEPVGDRGVVDARSSDLGSLRELLLGLIEQG